MKGHMSFAGLVTTMQGYFHFPPELSNIKSGPRWPQIQAAWNGPCKQFNPSGHVWGA